MCNGGLRYNIIFLKLKLVLPSTKCAKGKEGGLN